MLDYIAKSLYIPSLREILPGMASWPTSRLRIFVEYHVFPTVGWRSCLK
jgi:hypothetical protein